jgi:rfaE bifunctional protein nucleotidyltransferase chain/domain
MWEQFLNEKILAGNSLVAALTQWRLKNRSIVFTNGCFDILHLGHIDYLMRAADLGHQLVVGINSDASVRRLKGEHRPINDQDSRMRIMASLFFVSGVVLFDEDTPYELIKKVQPDVLVKGGDYTIDGVVGADIVQERGGEVKILDFVEGYSTTAIEKRIREQG